MVGTRFKWLEEVKKVMVMVVVVQLLMSLDVKSDAL
jgi:hypothetical protein